MANRGCFYPKVRAMEGQIHPKVRANRKVESFGGAVSPYREECVILHP